MDIAVEDDVVEVPSPFLPHPRAQQELLLHQFILTGRKY